MRDRDERHRGPRRPRWLVPAVVVCLLLAMFGRFDRSEQETIELGTPSRIIVINNAGPVSIRQGPVSKVTHRDSWAFSQPMFEIEVIESDILIRVMCNGRMPCRSSISLEVTGAPDLLVMADGFVDVDQFDGKLTVFSSKGGVALGPLSGSVRVVSNGPVTGAGLQTDLLDVSSSNDVDLWFGGEVADHRVQIVSAEGDDRAISDEAIRIEIATNGEADSSVAIRTDGEVLLRPPPSPPSSPQQPDDE